MNPTTPLYVATNLSVYQSEKNPDSSGDLTIDGIPYRRLDPAYYAWLRTRMEKASRAHKDGRLDVHSFDSLRAKFNEVHDRTVALFGEDALLMAVRSLDPRKYQAPTRCSGESTHIPGHDAPARPAEVNDNAEQIPLPQTEKTPEVETEFRYPEGENTELRFHQHVRYSAIQKVRAIEGQAIAAGWTLPELYQNRGRFRFPFGQDYGIACFIDPEEKLGAVTSLSIELVYPDGHSNYFRRPIPNKAKTPQEVHA